jgi:hypothetical protein
MIGPTLLLRSCGEHFRVGFDNYTRQLIRAFLCTSQRSYLWLLFWHFDADPRFSQGDFRFRFREAAASRVDNNNTRNNLAS